MLPQGKRIETNSSLSSHENLVSQKQEWNFDLVETDTPISFIWDPIYLQVSSILKPPHPPDANSCWDFKAKLTEHFHQVPFLFSDRRISNSHLHMNG